MKNLKFLFLSIMSLGVINIHGLDIPLEGVFDGGAGGQSIGYVDMDLIFDLYPQTKAAKDNYAKQLEAKRLELKVKEDDLKEIKTRIRVLESTLKEVNETQNQPSNGNEIPDSLGEVEAVEPGTVATDAAANPQAVEKLKNQLKEREIEFDEAKKRAEQDLKVFQNRQSQIILGKLYEALKVLAEEEQVSIVVDKSAILFGSTEIDLTEKLRAKIRGF